MKIKKSIAISDSGFVFDASTGDSFTLNPVGADILTYIRGGNNEAEIVQQMTEKYDVDKQIMEQYLYDFLFTLRQMQIMEDHG
jgi:PqqD family protein of HPr-rel-A system